MSQPRLKLADDTTRKPPRRTAFTKRALEAIQPPATGDTIVYDDKQSGLTFRVRASGAKAFYLYRKFQGRPLRLKLGDFPDMTIEQARKATVAAIHKLQSGENPAEDRRQKRQEAARMRTLQGVWEHYRDHHLKPNCSPATVQNDGYIFKVIPYKTRRLDTITTADIKRLHERLSKRGEIWANRVVQFLRRLYNYAIDELDHEGANPVHIRRNRTRRRVQGQGGGVALASEKSRKRYLLADEAPAFFKALDAEADTDFRDLLYMLLYTAGRRGNVQAMRWADIDLKRALWTIPAADAKMSEDITVPLCKRAVDLLKRRRKVATDDAAFVFPAHSASGHIVEPKKKWWTLRGKAGATDLHLHDLRRTVATWATREGVPYPTVSAMLGHKVEGITGVYTPPDIEAVRDGFEKAIDALHKAAKPAKRSRRKTSR